jgi:hypothetical protein
VGESRQTAGSGWGYRIVNTVAAVDRLAAGTQSASALQAVENGIDHAFPDGDNFCGAVADRLHDLVAIHLLLLKQAEDQEFGNSVHEIGVGIADGHDTQYTLGFKA